ncbi:class I SAM-dependent methyltransferase [Massilia sp. G4R7]|uniref:Class I SAM-dependent methyltransferase n=1 Tax=Massilia phyllostachyos TaxID=2898585 RepID=A0ABS8Q0L8_9BURK|nr:class I SAM-dependent methyltransferase [Massilia phyllostachyos]MCD2515301.1 class I SAM-dependent methyltransferase [Massilia phyllostachyos]
MSDWTGGYVAEIGYTAGYYAELNPLRIKLAFLAAGYAFPEAGTACELGFGQGVSTNVHAAASVTSWYGTDFNPAQAGFAQELAAASGADVKLYDQAFDEFCNRADLPEFDFIGLHGIWSWISDANRHVIVDFIRRKLKVGGVVYISYNTQPGWAAMVPLRNLLTEHAQLMAAPGQGIVPRIDASLDFAEKVLSSGALYGRANPHVAERLGALKGQNRQYLAHEYFNQDWVPMSFSSLRNWFEEAKLTYACSAHYLDHVDAMNLTAGQQELLNEIPDRMFRETVRDFMVNSLFRRDYWVRGARQLNMVQRVEGLRELRFAMATPVDQITLKVKGILGEADMNEAVYRPILDCFNGYRILSFKELEDAVRPAGVSLEALAQALLILASRSILHPAQSDAVIKTTLPACKRLNRMLCEKARYSDEVLAMASPVTGGAIHMNRVDKLLLLAGAKGSKDPETSARFVIANLALGGSRIVKEGKPLDTPEAELDEAIRMATAFNEKMLPMLKALRIEC